MGAITSIEVRNFRCFEKLSIRELSPVNLIVGRNNAGKTALLEAIEGVVSESNPFLLYRASFERGEYRTRQHGDEAAVDIDLRHWFHGHRLAEGVGFSLRAAGDHERYVERTIERTPPNAPSPPFVPGGFVLTIAGHKTPPGLPTLPLTPDEYLGAGTSSRFRAHGLRLDPPVGFVTTERLLASDLAQLWTKVVLTPREERTLAALRLVEPQVDRIAISEGNGTANARVLLRGERAPVPLGTLGEGISRILTLALHMAVTEGGFLLVDEIEVGLHWSVMPGVWRFLVETARILGVQVFATTHSKDCLEGLAELNRTDAALAGQVSVHRLEAGAETAVRFEPARIAEYIEMELEAR